MSEFEFISVFVSIVLAFAMAELLMGWGRLIRSQGDVQHPLFFLGWSIWLLLLMCFHYLGLWEFQAVDFETVGQLVLLLMPPIVLVLLVFVLAPERSRGQPIDLEARYFNVRHWLFSLSILFIVFGFLADMMLPDFRETWQSRLALSAPIVVSVALLMLSRNRPLHFSVLAFNLFWLVIGSIFTPVRAL
jgi:hypothetical protein